VRDFSIFTHPMAILFAAPHTPFDAAGALNAEVIPRQAQALKNSGCHGAFVAGSTGEWPSLTVKERLRMAEAWAAGASASGLRLIIHVGHHCLDDAKQLAGVCNTLEGVGGIAALAPSFFKPNGVDGILDWCREISNAAPDKPFFYYHIPPLTGVGGDMARFLELAKSRIPNLAGIKFTDGDMKSFQACTNQSNLEMFYGMDEQLIEGIRAGADGAVGSSYNFSAPLYVQMIAAESSGESEKAEVLQQLAVRMIEVVAKPGYLPMAKVLMTRLGVEVGSVRLPLNPVSKAQTKEVVSQLKNLGLHEGQHGWGVAS
jgi:N-acetylneuraminate lyase